MPSLTVNLSLDAAAFNRGLSALAELAKRLPELVDGVIHDLDAGEELFSFKTDGGPAVPASEVRMRLQPADRLLVLLAASGANDAEVLRIKNAFGHFEPPSVGDTTMVGRVEEGQ